MKNIPEFWTEILILSIITVVIFSIGINIETGLTPDSVIKYLPVSENIFHEGLHWFIFNNSYETTVVPPLYEFFTVFFMIFGLDVNQSSGLVSLISLSLLTFPIFYIGKNIGGKYLGYISVLLCCSMKTMWDNGTSAMSEMLFIFLTYASILFFIQYINNNRRSDIVLSSFFLVLANWTRWIGIFLLITYLSYLLIQLYFKNDKLINLILFSVISIPPVMLLYLRNILIGSEIYSIGKTSFSFSELFINLGMFFFNVLWDFFPISPLMYFNEFLMEIYFTYFFNVLSIYDLAILIPFKLNFYYLLITACAIIIVISIMALIFYNYSKKIKIIISSFHDKKWPLLFVLIFTFYMGILFYTETTTSLSLIDSRYLSPLYPLFIISSCKILLSVKNRHESGFRYGNSFITLIIVSFLIWQVSVTSVFLTEYGNGRGFSDPATMKGPAYQWLQDNWNHEDDIIINDGLRVQIWKKSFFSNIKPLPNRNYPPGNFLINLSSGTYIVITPVIGTKGPYRWVELKPYLCDRNRYDILLNETDEKIFRVL